MSGHSGFPPVVKVTEYQKLLKSAPNNLTIIAYCKSNHLLILQLQAKRKYIFVRPPIGLFYIERDPHSRTEIGERDSVLSAQE